jgi:hypothetical protein
MKAVFVFLFLIILLFSCEQKSSPQKTTFQMIMEQDNFYAHRDSSAFRNVTELKIINSDSLYVIIAFLPSSQI